MTLKNEIAKAKGINMPNDNITRAIKKGTGQARRETYETGSFEGYGPGGVAIIVDILTDNKNRTTSAVKHAFDKFNGNLGVPGCVSYMFRRQGVILIEKTSAIEEDTLMDTALEAGAEDMLVNEDSFEIVTAPEDFHTVSEALRNAGYDFIEADIAYVPSMEATPDEHDLKVLIKLIDYLEN